MFLRCARKTIREERFELLSIYHGRTLLSLDYATRVPGFLAGFRQPAAVKNPRRPEKYPGLVRRRNVGRAAARSKRR